MCVHTFGLTSSPSCSNFGLRQAATDFENEYGLDVGDFLRNHFYVDDGLLSVETCELAVSLIQRTTALCHRVGLKLHKFTSNSEEILASIPLEEVDLSKSLDLRFSELPIERALGVEWCIQSDVFKFRVVLKQRPVTRRGLLATVASVYDPLGFIAPFALFGKRILQNLCLIGAEWDDPIPPDLELQWQKWLESLSQLSEIEVPRCVKPNDFNIVDIQLHHFCDASSLGYGSCSYLRLVDEHGTPHVSLVFAKSRVAPIKPVTIPRLELSAAVLAVKLSQTLEKELGYSNVKHFFWCDSKVVLGYIANTSSRFHVFVANRLGFIHTHTMVDQWRHVSGKENIADIASRGCLVNELLQSKWFKGPDVLWSTELPSSETDVFGVLDSDPEVKQVQSFVVSASSTFDVGRFSHISSWKRLKKVVAIVLSWKLLLKSNRGRVSGVSTRGRPVVSLVDSITAVDLYEAEKRILKVVQRDSFPGEIELLSQCKPVKSSSPLRKLDCFLDEGLLKVGGRLKHSSLSDGMIHPVVIPKNSHIGNLIISHCHSCTCHQGKGMTLNEIRSQGYWILGCRNTVARYIYHCVVCRRLRASPQQQKMADLPADRTDSSPAFTFCGVDLFGPFLIRENRRELKRWGCIFTCLSSRAIHLEVVNSLSSSSFINALRRFIGIRGPISLLRCDQGTNFVGAGKGIKTGFEGNCR